MTSSCVINAYEVSKSYNSSLVLRNVTIEWEKGVLGLIGPNGAGKTTFIKILCTVLRPDKGYVRVFGKDVINDSFEVRRRIGVLFENPVFHPNLKVFSSLCWIGELRGISPQIVKRQVYELLDYFEIGYKLNWKFRELSAGMRQKFGLIFATLGTPPLIILDEPTSNLDPDTRQLFKRYVKKLVKENGCNFLISSHVLGELDALCDGFIFLFKGKIAESGKREDLKLKTSTQRFKIISKYIQNLIPILTDGGIDIESVEKTNLVVRVENLHRLFELDSHIRQSGFSEEFEIIQLESGIEALYYQLSEKNRKRVD